MPSEIELLGAYIPGWLIAAVLGVVLAGVSKVVLARLGLHRVLVAPVLFYCCLAFVWSGFLWLLIFK
ncbi:MAG: YtcA family lipoprotein [Puniceicoccales bacterium]